MFLHCVFCWGVRYPSRTATRFGRGLFYARIPDSAKWYGVGVRVLPISKTEATHTLLCAALFAIIQITYSNIPYSIVLGEQATGTSSEK